MQAFDSLAEQRIAEAIARGEFDDLPGAGRPLDLDDDRLVPPELRMAYRILRNAGFVPPGVEARKEIAALEALVRESVEPEERKRGVARLNYLLTRLALAGGPGARAVDCYFEQLAQRLERPQP